MKPTQHQFLSIITMLFQVARITSFSSSAGTILGRSCSRESQSLCLKTSLFSSSSSVATSKYTKTLFNLDLPEGRCVGVQLNDGDDEEYCLENWTDSSHWVHECLHPDEVEFGQQQKRAVRKSFLLGRVAMRASIQGSHYHACLKDRHGRPILPEGFSGSISHKGNVGVALSAPSIPFTSIGVDIERRASNRRSIARKVLTEREIQELGQLEVRVLCPSYTLRSRYMPVFVCVRVKHAC